MTRRIARGIASRIAILTVTLILLAYPLGAVSAEDSYAVTITNLSALKFSVKAHLQLADDTLFMHPGCPNYSYPDGWGSFVSDLAVTNESGELFHTRALGKSKWVIEGIPPGRQGVNVAYTVDCKFVKERWDVGNEQSGYYDDGTLYLCTRALFITTNLDLPSQIIFHVPVGALISAPWVRGDGSYLASSRENLFDNSFVIGDQSADTATIGNVRFSIAAFGDVRAVAPSLNLILKRVLQGYLAIFPDSIKRTYLITVFRSFQDDGEAYASSTALTLKDLPTQNNRIVWANQLVHELCHYWIGGELRLDGRWSDNRWFHEGFTEYFANLGLVRNGVITEGQFLNKVESMVGLYLFYKWSYPESSLVAAGHQSGGDARFGVYNGGWVTAFSLDMMIRASTHEEKTLEDAMRALYVNCRNYPISINEFIHTLDSIASLDTQMTDSFETFLNDYVLGKKTIPVNNFFKFAGLEAHYVDFQGECYLDFMEDPSSRSRFNAWAGK